MTGPVRGAVAVNTLLAAGARYLPLVGAGRDRPGTGAVAANTLLAAGARNVPGRGRS